MRVLLLPIDSGLVKSVFQLRMGDACCLLMGRYDAIVTCVMTWLLCIFGSSHGEKNHRLFTKIGQYNNIICPLKAAWRVASDKNLLVVCLLSLCTSLYAVIISKDGDILSIILHCMRASTFLIFVQEAMELSREGTHFILRIFLMWMLRLWGDMEPTPSCSGQEGGCVDLAEVSASTNIDL